MYNFKKIFTVQDSEGLINTVLSQTQRRTPTQVHPQFKISRIRKFYMRKIKYCQQCFHDKLTSILLDFPRLDDIHPFYSDLCNVLYDRDHYKLALGQVNAIKVVIDRIAKDYVRLMKYSDSPYKCKILKRAAMGRMATSVRKLNSSLKYLEEVRQHLSRLPSINLQNKSIILTGYPNVGKSSFINSITRANVEVHPYPYTTKSLYVGHFDFKDLRWQVIDTPGILDQPLVNRNTIELTAITALVHIQAVVLFFIDISEHCGFSIAEQISLLDSLKVLFSGKPIIIVLNKTDIVSYNSLSFESKNAIQDMLASLDNSSLMEISCLTKSGIEELKDEACNKFLEKSNIVNTTELQKSSLDDLYIANHNINVRPPHIPLSFLQSQVEYCNDRNDLDNDTSFITYTDDDNWKTDFIPEFYNGRNVFDFIDINIENKIKMLEKQQVNLSLMDGSSNKMNTWRDTRRALDTLYNKINNKRLINRLKSTQSRKPIVSYLVYYVKRRWQKKKTYISDNLKKISRLNKTNNSVDVPMGSTGSSNISEGEPCSAHEDSVLRNKNTISCLSDKKKSLIARRMKNIKDISNSTQIKDAKEQIRSRFTQGLPTRSLQLRAMKLKYMKEKKKPEIQIDLLAQKNQDIYSVEKEPLEKPIGDE